MSELRSVQCPECGCKLSVNDKMIREPAEHLAVWLERHFTAFHESDAPSATPRSPFGV